MEYDSESSGGDRDVRDSEEADEPARSLTRAPEKCDRQQRNRAPTLAAAVAEPSGFASHLTKKNLSTQVMEYYHKYSRDSNLDQYFSLPVPNTPQEAVKYYYSVYELSAQVGGSSSRQDCIGEEYNLKSYVPRERRRWVRPPLIGQSSSTDVSSRYVQTLTDLQTPSPDPKQVTPETIPEDKSSSQERFPEAGDRKLSSPTSSVASYKPLEWDSGADVGYCNLLANSKQNEAKLSTIERMALARGCSAALRLDPEGTTESGIQSGKNTATQSGPKAPAAPDANSTPLVGNVSGSESEIEITPIVKNHLPGIITGNDIRSQERCALSEQPKAIVKPTKHETQSFDTPTSSQPFKVPLLRYTTAERRIASREKEIAQLPVSPLKKSISMNVIPPLSSKAFLKRSQSELNLHAKEKKTVLPLIFDSTSSITTVVNKPATCDKVIQTSLDDLCSQESVGVQVSDLEENKLLLADGGESTVHSILKRSKGTYRVKHPKKDDSARSSGNGGEGAKENQKRRSSTDISQNASTSVTPQPDETENASGKANSFEYFPGQTYANAPKEKDDHVSSDTGRSNSTLPNSSSSVNEKLWGDSDSLVRDLERSVNILKSLVDANKCDKQVKKRLIQHVIKRLVTAKYTDDKIEHNLEDNVPWNPDDARNKVYRAELLQALTNKHSTTDSSEEWNSRKKDTSAQKSAGTSDVIKEVALGSSNSDKFDRNTDRTEMDGRKARLGLRTDDCQQSSNTILTDPDKSESSECFVPQRNNKNAKVNDIFCFKENCKLPHRESTTTNSIPPDHNRILLDAVVNNRRTPVESNNNTDNNTDWRLPTTSSERQFELKKCSTSESGDSKLVNYAEMEKRNQLIWITNEISHLCNLKKLLEQPRRLERPKTSPRKSKSANLKSKQATTLRREQYADAVTRSASDLREDSVNDLWSSHCNLASCEAASSNVIQRVTKRNSCTQTAASAAGAHSKTGGEIVSASRTSRSVATKQVAVGVQATLPPREAPETNDARDAKYLREPCAPHQSDAKCRDQSCQTRTARVARCSRCNDNSSDTAAPTELRENFDKDAPVVTTQQTQTTNCASDNSAAELTLRRASQTNHVQQKQKETKNQINVSKLKCSCARDAYPPVCDNKYSSSAAEGKRTEYHEPPTTCRLCSKPRSGVDVGAVYKCDLCQTNPACAHEDGSRNGQTRARACQHDDVNPPVNDADRRIVTDKPRPNGNADGQSGRAARCNEQLDVGKNRASDCAVCRAPRTATEALCERCSSEKFDDNGGCRAKATEHHRLRTYSDGSQDSDAAQQRRVQSSLSCSCDEVCSCGNDRARSAVREKVRKGYVSKPNFADDVGEADRNCKHCRVCGAMYQNTRRCSCRQTYPKAVAYELSFAKRSASKSDIPNVVQVTPNVPKQSLKAAKSEACLCDMKRGNSNKSVHQKSTLQDYLSRNNPEFVGNAETRRQYLSEICQLRELRKEKRIQLMAMASTSNIIKTSPVRKPTVCLQRKITDAEMKERLRRRYLRLNEVRAKRRQQERQEETRRNKLMAKIFCKRLQQKVLRGQVDLSQSISVISTL